SGASFQRPWPERGGGMRRLFFLLVVAVMLTGWLPASGRASDADPIRQRAEEAFRRGQGERDPARAREEVRQAASEYERLLQEGHATGALYHNLATAYLGAGDVGKAVLNYRRAERLSSSDDNIQTGLTLALQRVEGGGGSQTPWPGLTLRVWLGGALYLA